MGQALPLVTDERQISAIASARVLVATALLYCFTAHYVFLAIAYFYRQDTKRAAFYDMSRRLVLFGIAALLSANFLQYGIYHAICSWIAFITVVVLQVLNFMRDVPERAKNVGLLVYYVIIFVWFFGILFFYLFNALDSESAVI